MWLTLAFSRFARLTSFLALKTGFPRLPPVALFPIVVAMATHFPACYHGYTFSRACYRVHLFLDFAWHRAVLLSYLRETLVQIYGHPVRFFDVKLSCCIINLSSRIGKARRGDYSLSDGDGSAFKHTYNREALIDFPSEQRYRQLVNHYGQEKPSDRSNTLPTRSRKKHEAREKVLEEKRPVQTMKVGRVTVTAPTRV